MLSIYDAMDKIVDHYTLHQTNVTLSFTDLPTSDYSLELINKDGKKGTTVKHE